MRNALLILLAGGVVCLGIFFLFPGRKAPVPGGTSALKPDPLRQTPKKPGSRTDGVVELPARADLIRKVAEEIARHPPAANEPVDEKALDEKLAAIKKDYEARLARVRARAQRYRKPLRGPGEPGNAWEYYKKAFDVIKNMSDEEKAVFDSFHDGTPRQETPEQESARQKKSREIADKYKDVVTLIRKGFLQSYSDPGLEYEHGMAMLIPHGSSFLDSSKFIAGIAKLNETSHGLEETLALHKDALQLAQNIGTDGTLIGYLIGAFGTGIQTTAILETYNKNVIPRDVLWTILEDTEYLRNPLSIADLTDSELIMIQATVLNSLDNPQTLMDAFGPGISNTDKRLENPLYMRKVLIDGTRLYMNYVTALQEYRHRANTYTGLRQFIATEEEQLPKQNYLLALLLPSFGKILETTYRSDAQLRQLQIATALKLYSQETGGFPAGLEELYSKGYLTTWIPDPFTGEGFRYRRSDDGKSAVLYSVGPNLTDDQGKPAGDGEGADDIPFTLKLVEKK